MDNATHIQTLDEPPVQRQLRHRFVEETVKQRIRTGEWLPGQRLPSIAQLAKTHAVSSTSVREALRSLESAGLVKVEHGRGVFVAAEPPIDDLLVHFQDRRSGLLVALAEARRLIEPELAALAAERGTDEELAVIEDLAQQMEAISHHGGEFVELDIQFHQAIAHAARNPVLDHMMESVTDLFRDSRQRVLLDSHQAVRSTRYHLLITEALRVRNAPQARLLMSAHMNDMVSDVLEAEARAARARTIEE